MVSVPHAGEGGTDVKHLPECTCMCGSTHDCGYRHSSSEYI